MRSSAAFAIACLLAVWPAARALADVPPAEPGAGPAEDAPPGRPAALSESVPLERITPSRHADVGASFVFTSPVSNGLEEGPTRLRYDPGPGVSAFARIVLLDYLHVAAVFSWGVHTLDADDDALGVRGPFESGAMTAYRLEAHAMPTLPLGERVRLFAIVGLGWGRLEIGPMRAHDENGEFLIRGRGASYFDVPAGLGASIELIPRWMGLDLAVWCAPTFAKEGTAHTPLVAVDSQGQAQPVGPLPEVPIWFVQSLGLSLLL